MSQGLAASRRAMASWRWWCVSVGLRPIFTPWALPRHRHGALWTTGTRLVCRNHIGPYIDPWLARA